MHTFANPDVPRDRIGLGDVWIPDPAWLAIPQDMAFSADFQGQVDEILAAHRATCQVPDEMMRAILEHRVVVCPSKQLKADRESRLERRTGQEILPYYVQIVPAPKKKE